MEITLKVRRQDPESGGQPSQQTYTVDVPPASTVFDLLAQAREEQDGSLAFRGNCSRGFCGDCVMRANGRLTLMCLLRVDRIARDGEITVEPAPYAKPVRDLQIDNQEFLWDKYRSVQPWIRKNGAPAAALTEGAMAEVRKAMRCTMCGLCDFGCTVIDVDTSFLGPAALTKAYRFLVDPRDTATKERLQEMGEPRGMWDCVHCWEASEHCPYGIDPTHRIMDMRDLAMREGVKSGRQNPQVGRHLDSFEKSVSQSGWLDERQLAMDSEGLVGSLKYSGMALKMLRRGKLTLKPHAKRPGAKEIGLIFQRVKENTARKWRHFYIALKR